MKPPYYPLGAMLEMLDEPHRSACLALYVNNHRRFIEARGSSHNHQAWSGGFHDHTRDGMNLVIVLYETLSALRPLPFSLADALFVFFLHDIEKPWKYSNQSLPLSTKSERRLFRARKMSEYSIVLTAEQANALMYVEGEGDDYRSDRRAMNELAGFCHMVDTLSARVWHDYPKPLGEDPWDGAARING